MPEDRVVFLPEVIVQEHLGRKLPEAIGQEFEYSGRRYRVCQRDPLALESEIACELIPPLPEIDPPKRGKARTRKR